MRANRFAAGAVGPNYATSGNAIRNDRTSVANRNHETESAQVLEQNKEIGDFHEN